jgi:uncharacterized protein YndB with AHSA1/START domain
MKTIITVEILIAAPLEKVWKYWTEPAHITHWNFASDDWCAPKASNNLVVGGKFSFRMEAKDGSSGFDFEGVYHTVDPHQRIEYSMVDGRQVKIEFTAQQDKCNIAESFEAEAENSVDLQRGGWQAILNNFKKYVESTRQS